MIKDKKEAVSYALFVETIGTLTADGQTPSVRAVRSLIGGSNSTLLEYLRRWRSETSTLAPVDDTLSEPIKQALRAEIGRVARMACQNIETQLTEEKLQTKEARSLLQETEIRLEELETRYRVEREERTQQTLQLATRDEQIAELQRQVEKLKSQYEEATKAAHQMEIRAAVAEFRVAELEKSAQKK